MAQVFRRMRNRLFKEGKLGRYFTYALGEVVLVVLGILIALSINTWNQRRLDREQGRRILRNIQAEIRYNQRSNERLVVGRMEGKLGGLRLGKRFAEGRLEVVDTLDFLNKVTYGAIFSGGFNMGSANFFEEIVSTGTIRLLPNDSLKNAITDYYSMIPVYHERSVVHASDYLAYTNRLRPFNSRSPNTISDYDRKEMMTAFRSAEFRQLVDQELSYAYKIQDYVLNFNRRGVAIDSLIAKELRSGPR